MIQLSSAHVSRDLLAGKLVLVVEPQAPIALLEQSVVAELGATEVRRCVSADEGLATIGAGVKPDLAIVDSDDEEGAAVLIARLAAADVAIVVTSAADASSEATDLAVIRIIKPYLETELVRAIAAAMAGHA